jgi:hypothetical protein
MSREDWKELVSRYADGRQICNCREAYLSPCGNGILACEHGCSANKAFARDGISARVLAELKAKPDER